MKIDLKKLGNFGKGLAVILVCGIMAACGDTNSGSNSGPTPPPSHGTGAFDIHIDRGSSNEAGRFAFFITEVDGAASYEAYAKGAKLDTRTSGGFIVKLSVAGTALNDKELTDITVRALNSSGAVIASADLPAMLMYDMNTRVRDQLDDRLNFLQGALPTLGGAYAADLANVNQILADKSSWWANEDTMEIRAISGSNWDRWNTITEAIGDVYSSVEGSLNAGQKAAAVRLWFNKSQAGDAKINAFYGGDIKARYSDVNAVTQANPEYADNIFELIPQLRGDNVRMG